MRRILFGIASLFVVIATAPPVLGQVATGVYPFGTFDTPGIDTINVGNLNVHLSIPVLSKTGRGLPFNASLTYDSSIYYPVGVSGSQTWTPVVQFPGWNNASGFIFGKFSYSTGGVDYQYDAPYWDGSEYINVPVNCYYTAYNNWVFTDAAAVAHHFGGSAQTLEFNYQDWSPDGWTCPDSSNSNASGQALDGSGYQIAITNYTDPSVSLNTGTVTTSSNGTASTVTDSNGNQISTDGLGNFTDTTGNIVLTLTGNTTSSQIYTYHDTTGA